jgi:hypothetical protein
VQDSVVITDHLLQATLNNIDDRLRRIENRLGLPHDVKQGGGAGGGGEGGLS